MAPVLNVLLLIEVLPRLAGLITLFFSPLCLIATVGELLIYRRVGGSLLALLGHVCSFVLGVFLVNDWSVATLCDDHHARDVDATGRCVARWVWLDALVCAPMAFLFLLVETRKSVQRGHAFVAVVAAALLVLLPGVFGVVEVVPVVWLPSSVVVWLPVGTVEGGGGVDWGQRVDVDEALEELRRKLDRVMEEKEVMETELEVVRELHEAAVRELDERRALGQVSVDGEVDVELKRLRDERDRAVEGKAMEVAELTKQLELVQRQLDKAVKERLVAEQARERQVRAAEEVTFQLKDAERQLDKVSKERRAAEEALEEAKEQLAAAGDVSHGAGVYVGVVVVIGAALLAVWRSRRSRHPPALSSNSVSVQARAVGALGGSSTVELAVTNHTERPISIVDVHGVRRDGRRCEYVVHERLPIRVEARGTPSFQLQRDRRFGAADFVRVAVAELPFGVDGGSYTVFSTDLPQPDRQLEAVPVIDKSCIVDDRTFPARGGAYGIVTKAQYERSGGRAPVVVAVKKPHAETFMSEKDRQQLRLEAQHQYTLGLHHRDFVVQLVGIVEARRGVWLVMEWTDKGSLRQQLIDHDDDIGVRRRLEWAKQIAEAVRMVHDEQVVHCDLALRNVLLFDGNTVKLADFGLSRVTHDGVRVTLGGKLPADVLAPEVHGRKRQYTTSSDVYSFGILLWDLFSPMDQNAFPSDVRGGQSIGEFVKGGGRPAELTVETCACRKEMPVELLEALMKLMKRCWAQEPSDRPGMAEVADELGAMLTSCTASLSSMPDSVDEDEEQDEVKAASSGDDATDDEVDADEVDAGKDADGGRRGVYIGVSSS